jgi:hypothetical protein
MPIQAAAAHITTVVLHIIRGQDYARTQENTNPCLAYNQGLNKTVLTSHMKMVILKNLNRNNKKMDVR